MLLKNLIIILLKKVKIIIRKFIKNNRLKIQVNINYIHLKLNKQILILKIIIFIINKIINIHNKQNLIKKVLILNNLDKKLYINNNNIRIIIIKMKKLEKE